MKKEIIKKILTSKKVRSASTLAAIIVTTATVGSPWDAAV